MRSSQGLFIQAHQKKLKSEKEIKIKISFVRLKLDKKQQKKSKFCFAIKCENK